MKKILFITLSIFILSCKENTISEIFQLKSNKHNAERTNADLIITTPTTLSTSATYGKIEIKNGGSLAIVSNAVIKCTNFVSSVNHIYATTVNITTGSTFEATYADVNSITTIEVYGQFKTVNTNNYGKINVYNTGVHTSTSHIYLYGGVYKLIGGVLNANPDLSTQSIFIQGGRIAFEQCGTITAEEFILSPGYNNYVSGAGKITAVHAILQSTLTSSTRIKFCSSDIDVSNGGGTGSASTNCLSPCIDF